jgi:hypothetical protein
MAVGEEKGSGQEGDWTRGDDVGIGGGERRGDWGRQGLAARVFFGLGHLIYHTVINEWPRSILRRDPTVSNSKRCETHYGGHRLYL